MKIKSVELDDNEMPDRITFEMSRQEAQWIAHICGKHSPATADDSLPGYADINSEIYDALTGGLFNRFWDGGVEYAIAGRDERP